MTTNDLDLAREWAQLVGPGAASNIGRAAAEVIASLPDEWIDAEEVAAIAENISAASHGFPPEYQGKLRTWAKRLNALLPKPRTLAEMTREEREACQWAQADFDGELVLLTKVGPDQVAFLHQSGTPGVRTSSWFHRITPLPDLRRMGWPDEHYLTTEEGVSIIPPKIDTSTGHDDFLDMTPEDAPEVEESTYGQAFWEMATKAIRSEKEHLIDVQDYEGVKRWRDAERALGTAMGTNPPREPSRPPLPEDAPDGHYLVRWWGEERPVPAEKVQGQWWAIGRAGILPAKDVLIVSRLIPEGEQATEETPDPTRPEDVPEGEAWIVECYGDCHVGTREQHEAPCWALARMDGTDVTFASDHEVTLVSRLVPEVKA